MFFLSRKYQILAVLANVLAKLFPERVLPSVDKQGWLIFYQPIHIWEAQQEEEFPEEGCECHPGHVCHTCRAEYERRRAFTPIPF